MASDQVSTRVTENSMGGEETSLGVEGGQALRTEAGDWPPWPP